MRVLQFVCLHVLPQSLDDDGSGLGVDAQHACQSGVQFKLRRLQREKDISSIHLLHYIYCIHYINTINIGVFLMRSSYSNIGNVLSLLVFPLKCLRTLAEGKVIA